MSSVADANRVRDLEARIAALEDRGYGEFGERLSELEVAFAKLLQRTASLQGSVNAMRGRASVPDVPAGTDAAA